MSLFSFICPLDLKKSSYIFLRVFGLHQKLKNRMEINL